MFSPEYIFSRFVVVCSIMSGLERSTEEEAPMAKAVKEII